MYSQKCCVQILGRGGGGDARNLTFAQFASEPCNMLESSWGEPEPSNNISTNFEHILLHVFPEMLCTNSVGGRGGGVQET